MPHHSADVLKERLKAFVFYYEYKKKSTKNQQFPSHSLSSLYKKWNEFGQDFSTYWYRLCINKEEKEE